MAQDENRGLVLDYYEAVYNRRELGRLDAFLAPDFVSAGPGGRMDRDATQRRSRLRSRRCPTSA